MITSLLTSKIARIGVAITGVLALVGLFAYEQQATGARKIIEKSRTEAKKRNEKSAKIRKKAKAPGAADRLLRDYCRDC